MPTPRHHRHIHVAQYGSGGGGRGSIPDSLTNVVAWFKADTLTSLSDGNSVASWNDSSPNGRTLSQATGSKQPSFQTNELNTKPIVRFDAANVTTLQSSPFDPMAQPFSVFVVAKYTGGAGATFHFVTGDVGGQRGGEIYKNGTTDFWVMLSGAALVSTTAADANWHILCARSNTTSSSLFLDGGTAIAAGDAGGANIRGVTIGTLGDGINNPFTGDVAEYLLLSSPSVANENAVGNYLKAKYNLTWATVT